MSTFADMLDEACMKTLEEVAKATAETEEAKWQLSKLNQLHKLKMNELEALDRDWLHSEEIALKKSEAKENLELKKKESQMKEDQAKDGKKDRIIKTVMDGSSLILPLATASAWMAIDYVFSMNDMHTNRCVEHIARHLNCFKLKK